MSGFHRTILIFLVFNVLNAENVWYDTIRNWLPMEDESNDYNSVNSINSINSINSVSSPNANSQNLYNCAEIQRLFEAGKRSFDKEYEKGFELLNNGFLETNNKPFAALFVGNQIYHVPRTRDFTPSTRTLYGIRFVIDELMKGYLGRPRPTKAEIQDYLMRISACIPKEDRCSPENDRVMCDPNARYRTLDGSCNNLQYPTRGAAFTPFSRLLQPDYDDNVFEVRKNWKGTELSSARRITDVILTKPFSNYITSEMIPNNAFNMFGQLITHDIAGQTNIHHRPDTGLENATRCCSNDYKSILPKSQSFFSCMPIEIAPDDQYYSNAYLRCHNYHRSQPIFQTDCSLSPAQQVNIATGYIDLSPLYGQNEQNNIRSGSGGLLRTNENNVLPIRDNCRGRDCYFAGDFRVNQTPTLALWHSLFLRYHNILANTLASLNPHWDDERLYQEARRINIAVMQHIVYEEFVPIMIGEKLHCDAHENCEYDPNVDGTTTNDFTTGVFRAFHAFCPSTIEFYNENGQRTDSVRLSQTINDANRLENLYDDAVRGLLYQQINLIGYDDEMRNRLFGNSDLVSVDTQRGRDHGLPPYWKYREACGFGTIESWDDLHPMISIEKIGLLRKCYSSPKDIDFIVGGFLEEKGNQLFGPTFTSVSKQQFLRYKHGDRFFYTHSNGANPFTPEQLAEIQSITVSKFLCTVTNVEKVPLHGFFAPSKTNYFVDCNRLQALNLAPWKE